MPANTTKYVIPYPQTSDTIASLAAQVQALANRADLLLGESGVWVPTLVANTPATTTITLSRTYPGNSGANPSGIVIVNLMNSLASGVTIFTWANAYTGTATTITGFTLGALCNTAGARTITWRFLPVL